jgi:hypothetical protein
MHSKDRSHRVATLQQKKSRRFVESPSQPIAEKKTKGKGWPNDHVRFAFDYSQSNLGDFPITTLGKTTVAGFDGATTRGFGMRSQIDW